MDDLSRFCCQNSECPDCGHVEAGFETEEEAAVWKCPDCQPDLPFPKEEPNAQEDQG